MNKVSQAYM